MSPDSDKAALITRDGAVAIITMNLPASRNAYGVQMKDALVRHFSDLMGDDPCRAIVLCGSQTVFSAGGNLRELSERSIPEVLAGMEFSHSLIRLMVRGSKPIVAAVEGHAHGAGLALAAACDHVVVATDASLSSAFLRVGLVPDAGCRWLLTRRVGASKAKELMMLAESFDGGEAGRIGFADRVTATGQALSAAVGIAQRFAKSSSVALACIKASCAGDEAELEECFRLELEHQRVALDTEFFRSAVAAFLQKRAPGVPRGS